MELLELLIFPVLLTLFITEIIVEIIAEIFLFILFFFVRSVCIVAIQTKVLCQAFTFSIESEDNSFSIHVKIMAPTVIQCLLTLCVVCTSVFFIVDCIEKVYNTCK